MQILNGKAESARLLGTEVEEQRLRIPFTSGSRSASLVSDGWGQLVF